MSFLGVRDALLAKLTGRRQIDVGEALNGVRGAGFSAPAVNRANRGVPLATATTRAVGALLLPNSPSLRGVNVPVVPYDLAGRNYAERPAVSVYLAAAPVTRRDDTFLFDDPIKRVVESSYVDVVTDDGTVVRGPTMNYTRPHPDPRDYAFNLRVWARSETEAVVIYEALLDVLQSRGAIDVVLRDGTTVTYDTEVSVNAPTINVPDGFETTGDEGDFSIIMEYTVEGYADNSDVSTLNHAITQRTLVAAEYVDGPDTDPTETQTLDETATLADD